jgi:hypothetical protein
MRFMMVFKASDESEAGAMPSEKGLTEMGLVMAEMADKGVLLAGDGLLPSSKGFRIQLDGGKRRVVDGPFAETKEQFLGFYVIDVADMDQALDVARQLGEANPGGAYEVRPMRLYLPGAVAAE